MKALTKGQKLARKRRRATLLPCVDPVKKRNARGRARMADINIEAAEKSADLHVLETRARRMGIKVTPENKAEQIRAMRATWLGCEAGRAMASVVSADGREVFSLALLTVTADDMARMVAQVTAPAGTSALDRKWARERRGPAHIHTEVRG